MTIATGLRAHVPRALTVTVLAVLGGVALGGCSSSSSSASSTALSSSSAPASSSASVSASPSASASASPGSSQGDVCAQLEALAASVRNLGTVSLSANGLSALQDSLRQVQTQLDQLGNAGGGRLQPQVAAVKDQVQQLSAALETARNAPNAQNLAAARTALQGLRTAITALSSAVGTAC